VTNSVADIERWRPGDVREVFHATRSRAEAAFEAADGIATLPAFGTWGGVAADAAKDASEKLRKDLDAHGNEALAVAKVAQSAADDMQQVKDDLAQLEADAVQGGYHIDPATSRIIPGPNRKAPMAIAIAEMAELQTRLDTILANATRVDHELAAAISMATGKSPIPAVSLPAPVDKQSGEERPGPPNTNGDFIDRVMEEFGRTGISGPPTPRAAGAPETMPPIDPNDPQVKAATDFMRGQLQAQGLPPDQVEARIADLLTRAQQPLPAPPKQQPAAPQPAPSIGEQLGDAFKDFTNNVHEGFYDRAGETLNTVQNLTGTGGNGHPGVIDSWKDLVEGHVNQALTDPMSALGPANPLSAFGTAARELPEAIDNPGHYVGGKLFDGTAMAATAPLGGEGAFGRALLPEVRALEHGVDTAGTGAHHIPDAPQGSHTTVVDHTPDTSASHGAGGGDAASAVTFELEDTSAFLQSSEANGGHLIERHVGRTFDDLSARLEAYPGLEQVSTFATVDEAAAALSTALNHNKNVFDDWIASGARGKLELVAPFEGGSVFERGSDSTVPGSSVKMILKSDGSGGWYVLTGMVGS
jgi:hypothetical protein